MKFTASALTIFAASILVLQGCSSDTTSDRNELAGVLDAAADREGVPPSECRNTCVVKALAVFDECAVGIDDREECFGRAIHTFFECARECPAPEPPTCKDRCESHARDVYDRCIEDAVQPKTEGGDDGDVEKRCAAIAREAHADCIAENCGDPEPPTCEGECKLAAVAVLEECLDGLEPGGDEAICTALAREAHADCIAEKCVTCEDRCELAAVAVLEECLDGLEPGGDEAICTALAREAHADCIAENCEEPEPPTCDEECEAVAAQLRDDCVEAGGDLDECNMEARAALAICLEKHCEAPPTCEDRCGDLATRVFDACMDTIDSEERCVAIARCVQRHCNERCEDRPCGCDDEDSDSHGPHGHGRGHYEHGNGHGYGHGHHGHADSDSHGDSDSDSDSGKDGYCDKKGGYGHCD